jgi:hypothetical protein
MHIQGERLWYQFVVAGPGEPLVRLGIEAFHELESGWIRRVAWSGNIVPLYQLCIEFYALFHQKVSGFVSL